MRLRLFLIAAISLLITVIAVNAEEESITTYYPSPYGSYNELRTNRMAVGYLERSDACWDPDPIGGCLGTGANITDIQSSRDIDLIVEGSVGIGTTTPVMKLHIGTPGLNSLQSGVLIDISNNAVIPSPGGSGATALSINNNDPTDGNTASLKFETNSTSGATFAAIEAIYNNRTASSENGTLTFTTIGGGARAERMRITGSGNVGIGTTVPNSALQIGSSLPIYFRGSYPAVFFNAYNAMDGSGQFFGAGSSNQYGGGIQFDPNAGQTQFMTTTSRGNASATATFQTNMVIMPDGKVGIGTTSPGKTLDVAGDMLINNRPFSGITTAESVLATDISISSSTWTNTTVSMNLTVGSSGKAMVSASTNLYDVAAGAIMVRINRDNDLENVTMGQTPSLGVRPYSLSRTKIFSGLSSGNHNFKIQWKTTGDSSTLLAGTEPERFHMAISGISW